MEFSEKKEELDRFIDAFTQSTGPNTQFLLSLEEHLTEDLQAALEYCQDCDLVDARLAEEILELISKPGLVPYSAGLLVVSICAVDDYIRHLLDECDYDEADSYKALLYYLCANADELIRTLH